MPIAYTGTCVAHAGWGARARRKPAITASTAAMNSSCPISTPTLKNNSASGIAFGRQADFAQRAGEAQPVQQAEQERHDPRLPAGQAGPTRAPRA